MQTINAKFCNGSVADGQLSSSVSVKVLLPYFNFHFLDDNAVHFIDLCLLVSLKDSRGHAFPWRWLGPCYSSHSNNFIVVKILK